VVEGYAVRLPGNDPIEALGPFAKSAGRLVLNPASCESGVDAVFVLHEGRVVSCSSTAPVLFGRSREQIMLELQIMLRERDTLRELMARAYRGEQVAFEWHGQSHIKCTLARIEIEGHARLLAVAVDVTARRKTEGSLAQLSGRLLQIQDEERRRIARELHDNTGQNLAALNINLSIVLSGASRLDARAKETLQESIVLAEACAREIRTLSYLLHPPLLDELGLVSALRAYAEGYSERTGIRLELDLPAQMQRLPQTIEIALFRIVQEGLSNIHRHSGSQTALIRLKNPDDSVELEIADQGRGLPPGTLDQDVASASRIGVGIAGMRERARQLGGSLTITSGETGTKLQVVLPAEGAARSRSSSARR
jgi:two-component system NarL family sensor kinase